MPSRLFLPALLAAALAGCASPAPEAPAQPPADPAPPPQPPPLSMDEDEVAFREELAQARGRGLPILIQAREIRDGDFTLSFYNASGREISELAVELVPFAFERPRQLGQPRTVLLRGQVAPSRSLDDGLYQGSEPDVWENAGVGCVEIRALTLSFADGETRRYGFNDVTRMYRDDADRWCRYEA